MMGPMRSRPQDEARRAALREMARGQPQGGGGMDMMSTIGPLVGAGLGAALAAPTGGMSIPAGMALGSALGGSGAKLAQSAMAGDPAGMAGAGMQAGMTGLNAANQPGEDDLMDMIAKKRAMMRG